MGLGKQTSSKEVTVVDKPETTSETGRSTSRANTFNGIPSKPHGLFPAVKKIKSFADFKKSKGKQWKKSVSTNSSHENKLNDKAKERDVCINIGLLEWNIKQNLLKPRRGKRVVLRISNKANHSDVRAKALEKWIHCYSESEDYVLLYENGAEAIFLPGTTLENCINI